MVGETAIMQNTSTPPAEPSIEEKVAFLRRPAAYPERPAAVEVIETHMSWVFLGDRHVYKLKKPVRYPFLDFTTVELRRENCEREVRLNRRLAADVYLAAVALVMDGEGHLRLDGEGPAVDWLVKMRRLPAQRMLDAAIRDNAVSAADIERLALCLTRFYGSAERIDISASRYRSRFAADIEANRAELSAPQYGLPAARIERLARAQLRFLDSRGDRLEQRALEGKIVDAHGDLRPEHICLMEEPRIIDCLEFRREFRLLDPVDELAYLAMECERLQAPAVGDQVLRRYLAASGDTAAEELIDFYKAFRACLRAKIAVWHIADHEVRDRDKWQRRAVDYLDLAESYTQRWRM